MSTVVSAEGSNEAELLVKGAPEAILERCTTVLSNDGKTKSLSPAHRSRLADKFEEYAEAGIDIFACVTALFGLANGVLLCIGLRCIALAYKTGVPRDDDDYRNPDVYEDVESDLTFVGVAGMMDPPRQEVKRSITICRDAGIRVIVITGDNKRTAVSVCTQIGVFDEGDVSSHLWHC